MGAGKVFLVISQEKIKNAGLINQSVDQSINGRLSFKSDITNELCRILKKIR